MRERRGPFGRTVGALAESLASAATRRQSRTAPRVVVYDEAGHSRLLKPDSPEHERLLAIATEIVETVIPVRSAGQNPDSEAE